MAIEVPKEAENDVLKMQQLQQQLQFLSMQKQTLQTQSLELEHSTEELKKVVKEDVFEIVGAVMIKRDKDLLINDLIEKKRTLDLRQNAVEKQIDKVTAKVNEIQEKVMKMVKGGK
ncbi:Prefoldin subunit beta [Candidatus Tiddalikarchaeum anstoanum]|nr:Prefoldin subunit beta [Candidatus Tiddalikarchaeum anstoanum]